MSATNRRDLFRLAGLSAAAAALPRLGAQAPAMPAAHLEEITIADLGRLLASGETSARALVEQYVARIESIDRAGAAVHSVIEVNPEAIPIADGLDKERKQKGPRGPLHGVPLLVKDNLDTGDQMQTTAGSLALENNRAARDSFVVERLRAAGAVILGKTNLSEWANFRSSRSTSGWSSRGGQTRNPYALDRNPCGSSSGSGAAVAANLCVAAIGTETDGSIVCPAATNGIVGIKPTVGLVSRSGIIPISATQDTAGPMARTVADAAALLTAIAGVDPRDTATDASARGGGRDFAASLDPQGLERARIGVARKYFGFDRRIDQVMDDAIEAMRGQGAVIVDPVNLATAADYEKAELELMLYEFKAGLNAYLAGLGPTASVKTLADVIAFNETHRDRVMPYFGQEMMVRAEEKRPLTTPAYVTARRTCRRLSRTLGIDRVMTAQKLDALIAPTGGPAWTTDLVNGDHFTGGSSTPAAVAGYPSVTVPAGFVFGLPVGISFFGRAWSEAALIRIAYAYEQATKRRRPPRFLPTADLSA